MKILFMLVLSISFLSAQDLPISFDLRDVSEQNYVTYVKSQSGGTCWTHGSMAALESNLMITGEWAAEGEMDEPNLAEYHLDWWNGFNTFYNQDLGGESAEGLDVHYGGDYYVAQAYFSRADGAVRDEDGQMFESAAPRKDSTYHVYMPWDVEWYTLAENNLDGIEKIKTALTQRGALGTCMYANSQFLDDSITWSFYQPQEDLNDPNHSIAIVGWNDTLTTHASLPGAWLCKNSWGSGWGLDGFFWISYYDKHCGRHPEMGAVSLYNVKLNTFDQVYYHDYHGRRDVQQDIQEGVNLFESRGMDTLTAVSFYTEADSVTASIGVGFWDGFDSLKLAQQDIFIYGGYHTVSLNSSLILEPGDSFYVYVKLDKGGHAIDRTSVVPVLLENSFLPFIYFSQPALTTVPSTAAYNESYVKSNDYWLDLQYFDTSANLCLKVYSHSDSIVSDRVIESGLPENFDLCAPYPNPCNPDFTLEFQMPRSEHINLSLYDIQGRQVKELFAGMGKTGRNCMNFRTQDLVSGIYFITLKTNSRILTQKLMVLK